MFKKFTLNDRIEPMPLNGILEYLRTSSEFELAYERLKGLYRHLYAPECDSLVLIPDYFETEIAMTQEGPIYTQLHDGFYLVGLTDYRMAIVSAANFEE